MKWVCFLILITGVACSDNESVKETEHTEISMSEKTEKKIRDSVELTISANQEDLLENEYLLEKLEPIRANFKRINSIQKWTTVNKHELWESSEGGDAAFYYLDGQLEKIIVREYGEIGQVLTEYYFLNSQLSFVFEKSFQYDSHITDETFRFDNWEITEVRSYFKSEKLIHQLNNQDCGSPFSSDYLKQEEGRIIADLTRLIRMEE